MALNSQYNLKCNINILLKISMLSFSKFIYVWAVCE